MSSKYTEHTDKKAHSDTWGGETVQLSAEQIAQVLARSYLGGRVVKGDEDASEDISVKTEETPEAAMARDARRRQRIQEMRRRKKQQEMLRKWLLPCAAGVLVCVILAVAGIGRFVRKHQSGQRVPPAGLAQDNHLSQEDAIADSSMTDTDPADSSGDVEGTKVQEPDLDNKKSGKKAAYNSSQSIAGCFVGSSIADNFDNEFSKISSLVVRTLGGKSTKPPLTAAADDATALPASEVISKNVVFIDVEAGKILGQKDAAVRIPPASMTKILTILVAAEHITDPDDTFEITQDIVDYCYINECSNAGFEVGETVTVRDLFYGTVLPSGAEAAMGLAVYSAGSQEAFVELMNEKVRELGLSETTHFTNCIGIYDEGKTYSTVYDIAVILKAACDNSFCREVLMEHIYTTSITDQHPEGLELSNWFLRRIEDKQTNGDVLCAKTGYVVQSGNCAASLGVGKDGREYICVTANSTGVWECISDHAALYRQFFPS